MKFLTKILLAGLFMNYCYPELIYQYNKLKLNGSITQQIKYLDIEELQLNINKIIDEKGNFDLIKLKKSKTSNFNISKPKPVINKKNNVKLIESRQKILNESRKHIGIPYVFGSKDPSTGFDCSGFVSYVYKKSINYNLPQGSKYQFKEGGGKFVDFEQLKAGDLMFFSHNGKEIQHVAIFINKDTFIHSPRTGRRISEDNLSKHWIQKFVKGKTYL